MPNKILPNTQVSPASQQAVSQGEARRQAQLANMIAAPNSANGELVQPLPEKANVTAIKSAITNALNVYASASDATKAASEFAKQESDRELGARETLLITLAELSVELQCTVDDINTACPAAVTEWCQNSNTERTAKTVSQFVTECKRVMHPVTRDIVHETIANSHEAWEAERDAVKAYKARKEQAVADKVEFTEEAPAEPLQKAFAKRYHMVVGSKGTLETHIQASKATKKNPAKIDVAFADDFEALAAAHATQERNDPRRAARALVKLVDTLEDMFTTYQHEDIENMLKYARELAADEKLHEVLEAARMKAVRAAARAANPVRSGTRNAPKAPVTAKAPAVSVENTNTAIDELAG